MRLTVQGRTPLTGNYQPSGNSNEAIALIAASMLTPESVCLQSVPKTRAVRRMVEMAGELGAAVEWQETCLSLRTERIAERHIHTGHITRSVAAILFLAPILARRDHATLEWEQSIGRLHTHFSAMRDLGIKIEIQGSIVKFTAQHWQKQDIILTGTSVTATALVCMLAAVLGEETIIHNAASEPHLRSLQEMLVKMGAKIEGIGSNLIRILGGNLSGAEHAIHPDHIEIASIAAISAITPGHINIEAVVPADLRMIQKVYARLGITMIFEDNRLYVPEQAQLLISSRQEDVDVEIDTAPWPGYPSDLIAISTVVATQANGTTLIHEKLFNNRLLFVDKLKAMGAQIILCDPHRAIVVGPTPLQSEYLDNPDIRIGLALLGAALCAEGQVIIDRAELIERNFENVIQKLVGLGAAIQVEDT